MMWVFKKCPNNNTIFLENEIKKLQPFYKVGAKEYLELNMFC